MFMCKAVIVASLPALVAAGSLLAGRVPASGDEWIAEDRLRSVLPEDLNLLSAEVSSNIAKVEESLESLFVALPKDSYGRLGRNTARYALSRYFTRSIKGLEVGGSEPLNPSSAPVTQSRAANYLLHRVEESIGGASFGLRELALLAVAIEQLQASEGGDLFDAALEVHMPQNAGNLSRTEAESVLGTHMMAFVLGRKSGELASMDLREIEKLQRSMSEVFPPWDQVYELARDVLSETLSKESSVSRGELARVAAEASSRFETNFQEVGCKEMKSALLKFEDGSSGRVALPNFYQVASSSKWTWHFQENRDYLRSLAVLDESDKKMARVVVSNYLTAEPNCIADTGMSSLCCRSECDSLFQSLEQQIAAPEAEASHIVSLVEGLSTPTVAVPRKLSASMKQRLESVGKRHGGVVPLHGRLFAQWMHHAFPRECPYPRVPSAAAPREKARSDAAAAVHRGGASAMGVDEAAHIGEEIRLLGASAPAPASTSLRKEMCRTVVLLAALAATVVGLWRTMWTALLNSGMVDESHAGALAPAQRAAAAAAAGTAAPVPNTKERWLKVE